MLLRNICKFVATLLILFVPVFVFSQTVTLSGRVTDVETTTPLVGASVTLLNSNKGIITDVEGKFFIQVEQVKQYSLKITNIGFIKPNPGKQV